MVDRLFVVVSDIFISRTVYDAKAITIVSGFMRFSFAYTFQALPMFVPSMFAVCDIESGGLFAFAGLLIKSIAFVFEKSGHSLA
jgi:hypothetical protein